MVTLLVSVVDFHEKSVCRSETDHLDEILALTARGKADDAFAYKCISSRDRHCFQRWRNTAFEPGEYFWKGIPKSCDWQQRGKLMFQHVDPSGLKFGTVWLKVRYLGKGDSLELTLGV